jgi:hypothetical protein
MSYSDIADVSGLDRSTVIRISGRSTWRGMKVDTVQRFSLACGINLTAGKRDHMKLMRTGMRLMLRMANPKQRAMLKRILGELHPDRKSIPSSDI